MKPEETFSFPPNSAYDEIRAHLKSNFFSSSDLSLIRKLLEQDQGHLFMHWDLRGIQDDLKQRFIQELHQLDESFSGGIQSYLLHAKKLLQGAKEGRNPFEGFAPFPPAKLDLQDFGNQFQKFENLGLKHLHEIAFVLVAGGLGERLGYRGIKVAIPFETLAYTNYLQYICQTIRALEARSSSFQPIPLIIMTSEQTHIPTEGWLEANECFGLSSHQIKLLPQTLVPSFLDHEAHLALKSAYQLWLKPGGHGEVHQLLWKRQVAQDLWNRGIRYLLFIQDTNAQVFNVLLAGLGATIDQEYDFASFAVPRIPQEASGALVHLQSESKSFTVNVEYNVLETSFKEISQVQEISQDYVGNVNALIVNLQTYRKVLKKSRGRVPEFVNPKYKDETRIDFKEPARLETLMQDLPRLFQGLEKVGVLLFDRKFCFSPLKNRLEDATRRQFSGLPPECAISAEEDFFEAQRKKCELSGMKVLRGPSEILFGIPFTQGPYVLFFPSFGVTLGEIQKKIFGGVLEPESALILQGSGIELHDIHLHSGSALEVYASEGVRVRIENVTVKNSGYLLKRLAPQDLQNPDLSPSLKIRGYRLEKKESLVIRITEPGNYRVDSEGEIKKCPFEWKR